MYCASSVALCHRLFLNAILNTVSWYSERLYYLKMSQNIRYFNYFTVRPNGNWTATYLPFLGEVSVFLSDVFPSRLLTPSSRSRLVRYGTLGKTTPGWSSGWLLTKGMFAWHSPSNRALLNAVASVVSSSVFSLAALTLLAFPTFNQKRTKCTDRQNACGANVVTHCIVTTLWRAKSPHFTYQRVSQPCYFSRWLPAWKRWSVWEGAWRLRRIWVRTSSTTILCGCDNWIIIRVLGALWRTQDENDWNN